MEVVPIHAERWSDSAGAYVSTGEVIGYEVRNSTTGLPIARGETREDAVLNALSATWVPPGQKPRAV